MYARIPCPYCGHINGLVVEDGAMEIISCDVEVGPGCDRYFIYKAQAKPVITTFTVEQVDADAPPTDSLID